MIFIFVVFALILYLGFYFLGKILCKKIDFLKKISTKNSVIILSIILIPLVMTTDNEVLAYGIGYSFSPLLATIICHFLFTKIFSKKARKKEAFFNKEYYFGFVGIIILSYLGLLLPVN